MDILTIILLLLLLSALALVVLLYLRVRRCQALAKRASAERAEAFAERAAIEAQLQQGRDYLEALGEASSDALLLLDGKRQIIWGNEAAWEMFGVDTPAIGQTFIALVRDYELNQAVADAVAGHRPMVRQAATEGRTLRIWASPVAGSAGASVSIEDVTELQRLGRARRDFVANISHELRTPLANIDLAAQTLSQSGLADPDLAQRMLAQIQIQVQTLSQLSQEMMELAQIESGQVLLQLVPVPVEPMVRRSVARLLPQAAVKGQRLSIAVADGLTALMDEQQVGRVIANLVHNAIKFTPENGAIIIEAGEAGEDVSICVSDTGSGIPKDEQTRIFERFYKADRARSKGGTGLGLAIARHIVEGHGGRIWVKSQPGQGATFCFTLPKA